jgi:K+-transporting ATPase c subunit
MALTHLIVPDGGFIHTGWVKLNYTNYYKNKAKEGKWVILDNSAYEIGKLEAKSATGSGLGPELVLQAAEIINPSIVIAQDILTDRDQTLEATKDFINYVKKKQLYGKFKIMGVAQGNTEDKWLMSYEDLVKLEGIDQIGLSKISVPLSFGGDQQQDGCITKARLKCTATIAREFTNNKGFFYGKPVHLLGGDNWLPYELSNQKQYNWIFSNDSSAAVWYGANGQKYNPSLGMIDKIITQKPDLENHLQDTVAKLDNYSDYILHNIATLHKFSK